jgi:hypothetical protein
VCATSPHRRQREAIPASITAGQLPSKTKRDLQIEIPFHCGEWAFMRCYPERKGFLRREPRQLSVRIQINTPLSIIKRRDTRKKRLLRVFQVCKLSYLLIFRIGNFVFIKACLTIFFFNDN